MMKHGHENRHFKTLIRKRDLRTFVQHHRRFLITGIHNIQHQRLMSPFFERLGVKAPTTSQIQDPAFPRDLVLKKPNDPFRPRLERTMGETSDDPVQYPTLKGLQTFLNGDHFLDRYGF